MHHARGELLISLGDSVLAEQSLQRAIAVARSETAKLYEVRAATRASPISSRSSNCSSFKTPSYAEFLAATATKKRPAKPPGS
jgi:hypothetical protein